MRIIQKMWKWFAIGLSLAFAIAACNLFQPDTTVKQLPAVAPIPTPELPNWIEEITPTGEAQPLAQIRIRFKDPVIPLESLDSPEQQAKLDLFEIQPELPGRFRFLTPRMVGFQADRALPEATRIQVTVKSGLEDLNNHQLTEDLAWTFNTEPIKLTNLPSSKPPSEYAEPRPIDIEPELNVTSNVELDLGSVKQHAKLIAQESDRAISVNVEPVADDEQMRSPGEQFNPATRQWQYTLTPQHPLEKATSYTVEFSPGIRPARGNMASQTPFTSEVKTYQPLAFEELEYFGQPDAGAAYGRFRKGAAQLKFTNGLIAESARNHITIDPPPKEEPELIKAYDNSNSVELNPWALEPATTYTITIEKGLEDKFGQTLEQPITLTYKTGDVAAEIWAPANFNIFPSGKDLQLNISAVNLPQPEYKAAYRVVQPTDLVYSDSAYPRGNGTDLLPDPTNWDSFSISEMPLNETVEIAVPLREKLPGSVGTLAYGIQARTNQYRDKNQQKWREPTYYGLVQLTNLGVFAQWFPDRGLVKVNHLSDGSPVASTPVEIYQSQTNATTRGNPTACVKGTTDATGVFTLNSQQMQRCRQSAENAPELLVIARENRDWAFTRTWQYSGAYGYGIEADWQGEKPLARGTIFSDRQLYQPGETAEFTGVAYYLDEGNLVQDKNASYAVTLRDPDGNETNLGTQTTNDFGTFSLELPLDKSQDLGYYSLRAKGENGVEISGEFRVAEFNPPNFQVELNLDKDYVLGNEKVQATTDSDYLFGAPVSGGEVKYYITRTRRELSPKGWDEFSFGRQWFWPAEAPTVPSDVLQHQNQLNDSGTDTLTFTVERDLPYPMTYRVDAEVTDVSNLSVAESASVTVLPSKQAIGLNSNYVAEAEEEFPVEVIVTDPEGNAIAGQRVRLELQKMDYSSVTRVVAGSRTPRNQVEYSTVAETTVKSGKTPQTATLTAPESGAYRIQANFVNAKSEASATDVQIWATGTQGVSWGRRSDRENFLEVKLDKDTYQPGETATALIQSPYSEAELYFSVVRDRPLYQTTTTVTGGAPQIQFKVTEDMLPNAAVEAVLVRRGEPLDRVESGNIEDLVKIGFVPFSTSLQDKYLQVQVTPTQARVEPAAQETVELQVTDSGGNPVRGQFTVMVVNEAILQLTGYRPPDLVKTVYAQQPISTRWSDNRFEVVLAPLSSPLDKGWGYGGGFSAGAASTRIRTEFKPLAYYNGSVVTDRNGRAQVSFKLPDNLTTWRAIAVATTEDMRFGQGENTFVTTKPLMANPLLPQFVRPGDRFSGGVAVTNTTGTQGRLEIEAAVSNNLEFAKDSSTNQRLQAKAGEGTSAYRFPIEASQIGAGKVRVVTQLNDRAADAFEVPLSVQQLPVSESVVETGTTEERVSIPLNVNQTVVHNVGGLQIDLASTLIPEITAPARKVLAEDTLPFLEPAASQLTIASNLQVLGNKYGQAFSQFDPPQQAAIALERFAQLQQPDGGFAYYPGMERSDPFVSAYAAESLATAKAAGIALDEAMVSRARGYLQKILANPGQYEYCQESLCKNRLRLGALIALAELGDRRNEFLADIYAQRADLDRVARTKLARYLYQFPEWRDEARSLSEQLFETVAETGRSATVNLPQGWAWLSSPTTAQAQTLRLAIARDASAELRDRLLQGLLNLRRDGTWENTYANAEALSALVAYSNTQPTPPNFVATVSLAGETLDSMQFQGYDNPSQFINVAMDSLPKGDSDLVLTKSGEGTLHYLVDYSYRLPGNQPGRYNGLRVERQVRRVGEDNLLATMGLAKPDKSVRVNAGQVFEIGLEIISDRLVNRPIIADPLPAGFEAVDTQFETATSAVKAQQDSWQIGYQTIYKDRVIAYAERLNPGVYYLRYLVRSVTPGTYEWPGARVHLQYAPEEFGRSASSVLEVQE
ncbi:alpha-2-macroglobulin family protein [Phormidium sp. CCY1219]|uniref:alpha-2-macroglobulin family protein n=1 Tax=Phormidium sp. CCY1219 TaxID=2886104 RepID=UPI002D1F4110|nr:alpha-2-macroglobulin [Phormidium sp. CCY1219]MEB3829998.1 alpha-2-macroglobulin family protein [Phormidium sp. CCY1219]